MDPHHVEKKPCPFCEKETLDVLTWPGHTEIRTRRSAVAKSRTFVRKPDGFELLSKKCPNCGKTAREIRKAWKEGTPKDKEKQKKRYEEVMRVMEEIRKEHMKE